MLQIITITAAFLSVPIGIALAAHIGDGINQITVSWRNATGTTISNAQAPFNLSSVSLADSLFMGVNGLDVDVRAGASHIEYMPGTSRVEMLACFNNAAANETAACNESTSDDVTLPITGSAVYEFAADNQFHILHVTVSTPAIADWTVVWEYWDGAAYVALSNVSDGTNGFTTSGHHLIQFDFPLAGEWGLETLHAVEGYWIRARVSSATSVTIPPTAEQVWYETGRWWAIIPEISPAEEVQYDAHFDVEGGYSKAFHYYFPHIDGVIVTDDVTVQLTGAYSAEWKGYFDMTEPLTGTTKKIAFKDASVEVTIPSAGLIQAKIFETP